MVFQASQPTEKGTKSGLFVFEFPSSYMHLTFMISTIGSWRWAGLNCEGQVVSKAESLETLFVLGTLGVNQFEKSFEALHLPCWAILCSLRRFWEALGCSHEISHKHPLLSRGGMVNWPCLGSKAQSLKILSAPLNLSGQKAKRAFKLPAWLYGQGSSTHTNSGSAGDALCLSLTHHLWDSSKRLTMHNFCINT